MEAKPGIGDSRFAGFVTCRVLTTGLLNESSSFGVGGSGGSGFRLRGVGSGFLV